MVYCIFAIENRHFYCARKPPLYWTEGTMKKNARVHALITGRVQGVWFRAETKRTADQNGVTGWVRNRRDGSVEALFEGAEESVQRVLTWCRQGPPLAKVTDVDVRWEEFAGEFERFDVKI